MAMHIDLPPQLARFVEAKVASGRYRSADEVIGASLRLLEQYDELDALKLARLCREIETGLASGPAMPFEAADVLTEGRAIFQQRCDASHWHRLRYL